MKSWCWPPGRGFQTVWSACRLADEPRHRISLRDGPLAKPGASASPLNPVGIQCTEDSLVTERQGTVSSRWQQRVKNWRTARVKPGSDCSSVDLSACAFAGLLRWNWTVNQLIKDFLPEFKDQRRAWFYKLFTTSLCSPRETRGGEGEQVNTAQWSFTLRKSVLY